MSKPTLLIVGYNQLADGFQTCANCLSKDYDILFFPLLSYQNNQQNVVNDLSRYINGQKLSERNLQPNSRLVDVVFLWYLDYFTHSWTKYEEFLQIKTRSHVGVKFVGYNWDPHIIKYDTDLCPIRYQLLSLLYAYITGDGWERQFLSNRGLTNVYYGGSGFDPQVSNYQPDPAYECEVSIICTNLYDDPERFPLNYTRINRKKLVDEIYQHRHEFRFRIYGPIFLRDLYPDCYVRPIAYAECPKVFSNSKINLCLHAVSYHNQGQDLYFSERLPQILGCQGLLYCETDYRSGHPDQDRLVPDRDYILADPTDPMGQIRQLLSRSANHDPQLQQIIQNGYQTALRSLTWESLRQLLTQILRRST